MSESDRHVLLVEDNTDDSWIFTQALKRSNEPISLTIVEDAKEALELLKKQPSKFKLVLCDLNLPGMSGIDLIKAVRADARCKLVPIIMMSGMDHKHMVNDAYAAGCNGFLVKPREFSALVNQCSVLFTHWLAHLALPTHDDDDNT